MTEIALGSPLPMPGQNVLITGGLGFIGSNIAHRCLGLGANVTIYDCLDPRSGGNMHNVVDIEDSVEVVLNDIRNFEGLSACIRDKHLVFNCAAYTSHPNSMREPLIDIDVNCKGTINVLEAVRRFNRGAKIVHIGTSTQVGKMVRNPVDELHPEFPVDIYSANKSASEKYVLIYGAAYGLKTSVVRLANTFGPRSNIQSAEFGFVNYFVGLALKSKELTVYGKGAQLRNLSFVGDTVDALLIAGQSEKSNGGLYFAVSDRQLSVLEIAEAIVANVGGRIKYVEWPRDREVIEIGDAVISNAKIKSELGWKPKHELADGLRLTKSYFEHRLQHYL